MKTITYIFITIFVLLTFSLQAQELQLNTSGSQINWTGMAAFNSYSLTGSISVQEGHISIDNNQIISLKVIIDMKSLDHDNSDLKSHLRSKDFFEVSKYETATFVLSDPAKIENGKAILIGDMTIKTFHKKKP